MNKQLKRFLSAGLAAVVLSAAALPASAASVSDFRDVSPNAWYYNAVDYAASNGLFSGTGKNTFSPDTGMTRGMFVTVLGRKSGVPDTDPASTSFSDVKTTDYFAPYVEWAAANKIVSGTGNGKFTPNDKISRQEMATILYRYAQQTGNDTSVDPSTFNAFPDKGNVAGYAVQGMRWTASHGIIKGSGGKLDPTGTATRAQVAQVFLNAKDILTKTAVAEPEPGESQELAAIRQYLDQNLPEVCQWSEEALNGGWAGPLLINDGGWWHGVQYFGIEYVAKYCEYMLT